MAFTGKWVDLAKTAGPTVVDHLRVPQLYAAISATARPRWCTTPTAPPTRRVLGDEGGRQPGLAPGAGRPGRQLCDQPVDLVAGDELGVEETSSPPGCSSSGRPAGRPHDQGGRPAQLRRSGTQVGLRRRVQARPRWLSPATSTPSRRSSAARRSSSLRRRKFFETTEDWAGGAAGHLRRADAEIDDWTQLASAPKPWQQLSRPVRRSTIDRTRPLLAGSATHVLDHDRRRLRQRRAAAPSSRPLAAPGRGRTCCRCRPSLLIIGILVPVFPRHLLLPAELLRGHHSNPVFVGLQNFCQVLTELRCSRHSARITASTRCWPPRRDRARVSAWRCC